MFIFNEKRRKVGSSRRNDVVMNGKDEIVFEFDINFKRFLDCGICS